MSEVTLAADTAIHPTSRPWQIWRILKNELLYLCWALMEIAWLTPLAMFVMRWTRFWSAGLLTLWLLLLMLLPFNLVRFLSALQVKKNHQWRISSGALLVTLFTTWRVLLFNSRSFLDLNWLGDFYSHVGISGSMLWTRILILFLLFIFIWWRGLRLVSFNADIQQVGLRLRASVLIFVPLSLLPNLRISAWGIMLYVLLFFLAGLMAVALIRAEQVESERSGYAASLNPRWVSTIFLTSLMIVLGAGLFAVLVSSDLISVIGEWLAPVWASFHIGVIVVLGTVFFLATPLFFLLGFLITWLTRIFSFIFANFSDRIDFSLPENFGGLDFILFPADEVADYTSVVIPDSMTRPIAIIVMLTMVIFVSLAFNRRFRNAVFAPRSGVQIHDIGEGTVSTINIGHRMLQRLGFLNRLRTAASIRNIYQQMCSAAAGVGYARTITETPYEYLDTLAKVWPNNRDQSLLITEAYIRIRYGEIPETKDELEEIREAWRMLEQAKPEE